MESIIYEFDPDKNAKLISLRGISFEEIISALSSFGLSLKHTVLIKRQQNGSSKTHDLKKWPIVKMAVNVIAFKFVISFDYYR